MPQVGFEPTIKVFERAKTVHDSDSAATVIGFIPIYSIYIYMLYIYIYIYKILARPFTLHCLSQTAPSGKNGKYEICFS
jgi:hypothetical protein